MSNDAQDGLSRRTMFKAGGLLLRDGDIRRLFPGPPRTVDLGGPDEEQLGAIEVGKLGDLVVLNRDYFTIPVADLRQVRSVLTVLGREVVHS